MLLLGNQKLLVYLNKKETGTLRAQGRRYPLHLLCTPHQRLTILSMIFVVRNIKQKKCFETLKLSGLECAEKIKSAGLCFKCLKKGHLAKGCFAKCKKYNGKHNIIMCGVLSWIQTGIMTP